MFQYKKDKVHNKKQLFILNKKVYSCTAKKHLYLEQKDAIKIIDAISLHVQRIVTTAILHQKTFSEFKNTNKNKNVVLIGGGPTVNAFSPIPNAVYVGLNRAFLYDKVHFNYLFAIDKIGIEKYYDEFIKYDCTKFIGDQNITKDYQIPQSYGIDDKSVRRYKTTSNCLPNKFAVDIDTEALANSCTVSLQAMQFILFTNPKRIYVVGIDCTAASRQYFVGEGYDTSTRGENLKNNDRMQVTDWKRLKNFVAMYFPETEIYIVNPIGLKGIFKDVYTKSFLDKHPEIDASSVEILDNGKVD